MRPRPSRKPTAEEIAADVARVLEPVFARLDMLADVVLSCWRESGMELREEHLTPVAELITRVLPQDALMVGFGYIADIGRIQQQEPHFMMWWQKRGLRATRLRVNSEPNNLDLYDYARMEWFTRARDQRRPVVVGPYVDYSGSELFTTTVTMPVYDGDAFLGVAGADLHFRDLERALLTELRQAEADACLVDFSRRVIAANSARWVVADRLRCFPTAGEAGVRAVAPVSSDYGWYIALGEDVEISS